MSEELKKLGEAAQLIAKRGGDFPRLSAYNVAERLLVYFRANADGTFNREYPVGGDGFERSPKDGKHQARVELESLLDPNFISSAEHFEQGVAEELERMYQRHRVLGE